MIMELLQFVFSSFWVWLGTVILICAMGAAAAMIIPNFSYRKEFKQ